MSNYIKKPVKRKDGSRGSMDIIPDILKETLVISNDTPQVIIFGRPSSNKTNKLYEPGTQNLFKQNTGWILEQHFSIHDLNGTPIFDTMEGTAGLPDRFKDFQATIFDSTVIHKKGEFEILKDDIYGYIKPFPNMLYIKKVASEPIASVSYDTIESRNYLSKSKISGLGYKYPGENGLKLITSDTWTCEINLQRKFPASCNGMIIMSKTVVHRATDGAV